MDKPAQLPPMPPYIRQSLEKVRRSLEFADELFDLCLKHSSSQNPDLLLQAGSLVGDFANNLRSALNYTTKAILEREVIPHLSPSDRKKVNHNLDFPWASSPSDFDEKPISRVLKRTASPLYTRIWQFQPFHPGQEWLGDLMTLSNRDKHVVINTVLSPIASDLLAILPDGTQQRPPWILGDKLVIITKDGPAAVSLPAYYPPIKAFATTRGTWSLYVIPLFERFSLDLVDFTSTTPFRVMHVLAAMEAPCSNNSTSEPE